tara:strand:- start:220 stop:759 length:540 start_codon:yes stop_codon:yes gene_type:complete
MVATAIDMKINELETGRRIGAGRNPVQDRGTGGAFSGNPPSPSITNKLGANGPAKTGTNVLKKAAAKTGFQSAIKSPATSMGDDNSDSQSMGDDDTSNASPTTGTTGTQSAQDMQNSSEETFDVMSGDKVPSIELTDLEVNIQPGSKKAELVSKDKQTKIEMSQEDLLARMQELSGIQQ